MPSGGLPHGWLVTLVFLPTGPFVLPLVEVWLASTVPTFCGPDCLSFLTLGFLILGIRYQTTVPAEALGITSQILWVEVPLQLLFPGLH